MSTSYEYVCLTTDNIETRIDYLSCSCHRTYYSDTLFGLFQKRLQRRWPYAETGLGLCVFGPLMSKNRGQRPSGVEFLGRGHHASWGYRKAHKMHLVSAIWFSFTIQKYAFRTRAVVPFRAPKKSLMMIHAESWALLVFSRGFIFTIPCVSNWTIYLSSMSFTIRGKY